MNTQKTQDIVDNVKAVYREKTGKRLSDSKFARLLNISRQTLIRWLKGEQKMQGSAEALFTLLDKSPTDIFKLDEAGK